MELEKEVILREFARKLAEGEELTKDSHCGEQCLPTYTTPRRSGNDYAQRLQRAARLVALAEVEDLQTEVVKLKKENKQLKATIQILKKKRRARR